jgi:hypothetical protein
MRIGDTLRDERMPPEGHPQITTDEPKCILPGDAGVDEQSIVWLAQDPQQQPPFMSGGPPHSEELYHTISDVAHLALLDRDTGFATV